MIEVLILFAMLGIASRRSFWDWLGWRLRRPYDVGRPGFHNRLDEWRSRRPGR